MKPSNIHPDEPDLKLLPAKEYLQDLRQELLRLPKSVKIICFKIMNDRMMRELRPALLQCLRNNSSVKIYTDALYSKHRVAIGFLPEFSKKYRHLEKKLQKENKELFTELITNGAYIHFINEPGLLNRNLYPFMKRDHRKVVLLAFDNKNIAYFGATNFEAGEHNDYMIKTSDEAIIKDIKQLNSFVDKKMPKKDVRNKTNQTVEMFLDTGKNFRSVILTSAIKAVDNAQKTITYVSQLSPELPLMIHFYRAAKRGVFVEIILPSEDNEHISKFPFNTAYKMAKAFERKNKNIRIHNCSKGFTHAKILKVDTSVFVGSHNLSYVGVIAGTVEFSTKITSPSFLKQVDSFIESIR